MSSQIFLDFFGDLWHTSGSSLIDLDAQATKSSRLLMEVLMTLSKSLVVSSEGWM